MNILVFPTEYLFIFAIFLVLMTFCGLAAVTIEYIARRMR
jgi:hypothetical protein